MNPYESQFRALEAKVEQLIAERDALALTVRQLWNLVRVLLGRTGG